MCWVYLHLPNVPQRLKSWKSSILFKKLLWQCCSFMRRLMGAEAVNFLGSCFCSCHRCVQPTCCSSQPPPAHRLLSAARWGRQQTQPEEPCDSWGREGNARYRTAAACSPISHFHSLCWLVSALVGAARCEERRDGNCGQSQERKEAWILKLHAVALLTECICMGLASWEEKSESNYLHIFICWVCNCMTY